MILPRGSSSLDFPSSCFGLGLVLLNGLTSDSGEHIVDRFLNILTSFGRSDE